MPPRVADTGRRASTERLDGAAGSEFQVAVNGPPPAFVGFLNAHYWVYLQDLRIINI